MKHIFMLAFLVALLPAAAFAAQFGLSQGESLADISKVATLKKMKPFVYSTPSLPDGNDSFNDYRLIITPDQGLCKVIAWTPDIESSVYGDAIKDKFAALYDALDKKYGMSKKLDALRPGSIWDDPQDWMMGLAKNERFLMAIWSSESGASLPPDVEAIGLEAHGTSSSKALISLSYEFTNFDSCEAAIKAAENSSL